MVTLKTIQQLVAREVRLTKQLDRVDEGETEVIQRDELADMIRIIDDSGRKVGLYHIESGNRSGTQVYFVSLV